MSAVIASNIPQSVSVEKLQEFFSFCGKIKTINLVLKNEKLGKYEVQFELEKALNTALLLNDAELDGVSIKVEESDTPPNYAEAGSAKTSVSDNKVQSSTLTGDESYDDISQEEKPKYAIMAQLLSSGYVLSDNLIQKSIEVDNDKGYSAKFKSFLTSLDEKYIHSSQPESTSSKGIAKAQSTLSGLTTSFNQSGYPEKLNYYLQKASSHPYGVKVHDFYQNLAKDVKEVHNEARRLSELKKEEQLGPNAATANAAAAINTAND